MSIEHRSDGEDVLDVEQDAERRLQKEAAKIRKYEGKLERHKRRHTYLGELLTHMRDRGEPPADEPMDVGEPSGGPETTRPTREAAEHEPEPPPPSPPVAGLLARPEAADEFVAGLQARSLEHPRTASTVLQSTGYLQVANAFELSDDYVAFLKAVK